MGNNFCGLFNNYSNNSKTKMASNNNHRAVIIPSKTEQQSTLIFLHGLGDNGSAWSAGFKMIVPSHCKIICPNASSKPVTLNGGNRMPSWFDIHGLSIESPQDEDGVREASKLVDDIVKQEIDNGISADKIVIGGFSQGGAVALFNSITNLTDTRYAGVIALSTWLPIHKYFLENPDVVKIDKSTPFMQFHGEMDPVVPSMMGKKSHGLLKTLGLNNIEFKSYGNLMHSSCPEEMQDVSKFLEKVLNN